MIIDRTEQDIMKNWGTEKTPVVSVCCATFNHEKYISEAINSILIQETNFPFEIIVRDDCSTDQTATIIRGFVEKYPNIINPIYETENQYSKGVKPMPVIHKRALGEYFALCDGDDYWTDKEKLQIQTDEMKRHPELDLCFHHATDLHGNKEIDTGGRYANENKIYTTSEVILGDGGFCATASLMLRNEVIKTLPDWFYTTAPVGDYFMQIYGSVRGGALYLNKNMCIYRTMVPGSWTDATVNIEKRLEFIRKLERSLNFLNAEFGAYQNEFKKIINKHYFKVLKDPEVDHKTQVHFYKQNKDQFSQKQNLLWLGFYSHPSVCKAISDFKRVIRFHEFKQWIKRLITSPG